MPRIATANPDTLSPKTKGMLDAVNKALGVTPNMMKTMATAPVVLEGYLALSGALGHGELPGKIREQIALFSAQNTSCEYCLAAHTVLGGHQGLAAGDIASARKAHASDPKAAAALALSKRIVETHGGVSDADIKAAKTAGLSDAQVLEVVANVSLNLFTNFFNKVAGVDVDFPKVALNA